MIDIKVPTVGESINEVTLVKWLKKDGDYVQRDEVLAELESEKATFEVNAEKAGVLKTVGKEGDTFKIKLTDGNNETYYFIDAKTYLLTKSVIKSEMMGQSVDVTTTYSDYKKTDFGITLPHAKNIDMGMFQLAQKVDKVEVNKQIDPKIFEMPK